MRYVYAPLYASLRLPLSYNALFHNLLSSLFIRSYSTCLTSFQRYQYRRFHSTSTTSSFSEGYEAFGSFHTPSISSLFAQVIAKEDISHMTFQSEIASQRLQFQDSSVLNTLNRSLFALDLQKWTFLNHGAFGTPTKVASEAQLHWRSLADAQPLKFNDRDLFPLVVRVIKTFATFINVVEPEKMVLLPNATAGLHAVLTSVLSGKEQQTVVLFSTRYGAVRKMLRSIDEMKTLVHVHEESLSLDESLDDQRVLEKLDTVLTTVQASGQRVALLVVDHITSNTAVTLPVKDIVQHCHARDGGIPVLIDGAHALLNLPLDLEDISADYYVGNCHKWFCSTRGAAFLHVARADGPPIRPRVISHGFFDGMQSAFMWTGLQDYSSWLALPQCLAFWQRQGVDETRKYMHTLAQDAAELLYSRWKMSDHLTREREVPKHKRHAMRLVQLPTSRRLCGGVIVDEDDPKATVADAKRVQDGLHYFCQIEVPVKCVDGRLYVRLSAHVYNCLDDFEKLADAAVEKN